MKCEKCGKEATFYYSSNINGEKTERHLCEECARSEGFGGALDYDCRPMFSDMVEEIFSDFFAPTRSLFPSFGSFGLPMRSIMTRTIPRLDLFIARPEEAQENRESGKVPADAGEDVKRRRELTALKEQLDEAVRAEDFEKAIVLRDRIREKEK